MVTSHLRMRRILNKTSTIVLKTNRFKAWFGPKLKIRHVVGGGGIYIGGLYLILLTVQITFYVCEIICF